MADIKIAVVRLNLNFIVSDIAPVGTHEDVRFGNAELGREKCLMRAPITSPS